MNAAQLWRQVVQYVLFRVSLLYIVTYFFQFVKWFFVFFSKKFKEALIKLGTQIAQQVEQ